MRHHILHNNAIHIIHHGTHLHHQIHHGTHLHHQMHPHKMVGHGAHRKMSDLERQELEQSMEHLNVSGSGVHRSAHRQIKPLHFKR